MSIFRKRVLTDDMKKALFQRRIFIGAFGALILGLFIYINDIMIHTKVIANWIYPLAFFLFAWGIYKKNKFAAWLCFLYFIISQTYLIHHTRYLPGVFWLIFFTYCFILGIRGVSGYQRWMREKMKSSKIPPNLSSSS